MTLIRTIRAKKGRINHERGLHFDKSVNQAVVLSSDSRHNFGGGDFTISLILNIDSEASPDGAIFILRRKDFGAPQMRISIASSNLYFALYRTSTAFLTLEFANIFSSVAPSNYLNKIVHLTITRNGIDSSGNGIIENYHVYINGRKITPTGMENLLEGDGSFNINLSTSQGIIHIGANVNSTGDSPTTGISGFINNCIILNSSITADQVKLMHTLGGVIPSALHSNVINHWPLTQKSYYKDGTDIRAWDCVEQYNYEKKYIGTKKPESGDFTKPSWSGATEPIIRYGADADGNYVEFESVGTSLNFAEFKIELPNPARFGWCKAKIKLMTSPCEVTIRGGVQTIYDSTNSTVGVLIEHHSFHNHNSLVVDFLFNTGTSSVGTGAGRIVRVYEAENGNRLSPTHGVLKNFPDNSVTHSTDNIKDIYSKESPFELGLKFDDASEITFTNDSFNVAIGESFSIEWTELGVDTANSEIWALIDSALTSGIYPIRLNQSLWSFIIDFSGNQATGFAFTIPAATFKNKLQQAIITVDNTATEIIDNNGGTLGNTNPTSVVRLYLDGVEYVPNSIHARSATNNAATYFYTGSDAINCFPITFGNRAPTATSTRTSNSIHSFIFYDKKLTINEIKERKAGKLSYPGALEANVRDAYSFVSKTPVSLKNGDVIALTTGMTNTVYLRDTSGIQELKNALRFISANLHYLEQTAFNYNTASNKYTFLIISRKPTGTDTYASGGGFRDTWAYYTLDVNNFLRIGGRPDKTIEFAYIDSGVSRSIIWNTSGHAVDDINFFFFTVDQDKAIAGQDAEELYINGNHVVKNSSVSALAKVRFDLFSQLTIGRDVFGGVNYDGFMLAYGLWDRFLTVKEMKAICNNLFFNVPQSAINGLQQLNLFNEKDAINGIIDQSGNGNHIDTFVNWTTADLDPADPEYKFVKIDKLR